MVKKTKILQKPLVTIKNRWLLLFLVLAIIPISIISYFVRDYVYEQIIATEFHQDIKQFPTVHVDNFMLWEGDSLVGITIPGKGKVSFWYGADKVPRIESIGKYETTYQCFYVDLQGKKLEDAYTTDLELETNTYAKWFPFKVHSIKDVITNYDDIIAILKTFPKHSPNYDDANDAQTLKTPSNPKFITKTNFQMKPVVCELYE